MAARTKNILLACLIVFTIAAVGLFFAMSESIIKYVPLIVSIWVWMGLYFMRIQAEGRKRIAKAKSGKLPSWDSLVPPAPDRLVAVARVLFPQHEMVMLQHGTCLVRGEKDKRGIDEQLDRWRQNGPNMDDGTSYQLKDRLGWFVTCGAFPSGGTIILNDETGVDQNMPFVTLLGFVKRQADFKSPVQIFRQ